MERELSEAVCCMRKSLYTNIIVILSSLIPGAVCVMASLG